MSDSVQPRSPTFMLTQLVELTEALFASRVSLKREQTYRYLTKNHGQSGLAVQLVVEEIAKRRNCGESYAAIAVDLNRRGVRSRNGARWYMASVRALFHQSLQKSTFER